MWETFGEPERRFIIQGFRIVSEQLFPYWLTAAQGADYLLTWNFKHINNAEMKSAITKVVQS
jgi:hypothetical protein